MYEPDSYISEAIQIIAWDIQDENFPDAFNAQVRQMSGASSDDLWRCADDGSYPIH